MRSTLLAFVTVLSLAGVGCGNNSNSSLDGGNKDLGGATDLATATRDMARLGCADLVACYNDCAMTATDAASYETCSNDCDRQAGGSNSQSVKRLQAAIACGQSWCLALNDAGSGDCALNADQTRLVDPAGRPMGTCTKCLNDALARLFGDMCQQPNGVNCNPMACTGATDACLNN